MEWLQDTGSTCQPHQHAVQPAPALRQENPCSQCEDAGYTSQPCLVTNPHRCALAAQHNLQHNITGASARRADRLATEYHKTISGRRAYLEELLCKQLYVTGMKRAPTEPAVDKGLQAYEVVLWPERCGVA